MSCNKNLTPKSGASIDKREIITGETGSGKTMEFLFQVLNLASADAITSELCNKQVAKTSDKLKTDNNKQIR